jgi:hypothetical protein
MQWLTGLCAATAAAPRVVANRHGSSTRAYLETAICRARQKVMHLTTDPNGVLMKFFIPIK